MKVIGSHSILSLILFLAAGALIGGILGHLLSEVSLAGIMPYLTAPYELFNLQDFHLNLFIMDIHFGIRLAPNLISILGILIAAWIYSWF